VGIDWSGMRPQQNVDPAELESLISRQAEAFQGMPYHWATDSLTPDSYHEQSRAQFERAYLESSRALKKRLAFPEYDDETNRSGDYPDLAPCWRVYPITHNTIFSPQWRLRAHRTFLPDELGTQIEAWRGWLSAVEADRMRRYLLDLYVHEATKSLFVHDELLRELARASLTNETTWARRPELKAVRERILGLAAAQLVPAPIGPPAEVEPTFDPGDDPRYHDLRRRVSEVCTLTRDWNWAVRKQGWRLMGWDRDAHTDFEGFLAQARDPWLLAFLDWAKTCGSLGMGLFLDY
jgi:hypothetical protein